MMAQRPRSDLGLLQHLRPHILFLLALGSDRPTRDALERELDRRALQRCLAVPSRRSAAANPVACET